MKKISMVVVLLLACFFVSAQAGNRSGTVTAQFLKMPVNARAAAMGNAQVALAVGTSSIAYNPAGMLAVDNAGFSATYNAWFADITHSFIGAAVNLRDWGHVGVALLALTTDDMIVTTPAFPEGTGEKFRAGEYAYVLSYARQISLDFSLGLNVKYIKSYLYNTEVSSGAIAFDVGSLYDIPALRSRLGISVNNLGKDLKYIYEQYSLPTVLRFGIRTAVYNDENHLVYIAFQVSRPNDADEQYNLGFEYTFNQIVSLRGGYRFNYDTERWSGGLGVSLKTLGINGTLDYAYTDYRFLGGTNMFSLEIGF